MDMYKILGKQRIFKNLIKDSSDFNNALNTHFTLARISMVISGRMKGIPFFHRVPQIENISKFSISIKLKKNFS